MTQGDAESGVNNATALFKRACDPCRTRKVRCDKGSPCSSCKASGIPCRTSDPGQKARRKRVHVTEEYEKKIDHIQARLNDLDSVLHHDGTKRIRAQNTAQAPKSSYSSPYSTSEAAEDESAVFEGGTSMRAHSAYARELLEKAVSDGTISANSPEMSSALAILKRATGRLSSAAQLKRTSPHRPGIDARFDFRQLPLPPTEAVLEILRRAKEIPTLTFATPFSWMDLHALTELCKAVFFCIDSYPASTAVLTFGHLYYLFTEFSWTSTNEQEKTRLETYASLCRDNFEVSLSNIEILLVGSYDNVSALVLGACWATETCRPIMASKLTAAAANLAQTMGWHRASVLRDEDDEQKRSKSYIFWWTYALDKSLSMRLGRASTLQDYDIDIDLPTHNNTPFGKYSSMVLGIWAKAGRIQGLVYEQLYSPSALKQHDSVQKRRASALLEEVRSVQDDLVKVGDVRRGLEMPKGQSSELQKGVLELLGLSDELVIQVVYCLIFRAIPDDDGDSKISQECLQAARVALEMHQNAVIKFRGLGDDCWSMYLHWTILHTPFIPFTVIFANVLNTSDSTDLRRLGTFADSLSDSHFSEGAAKMFNMCSTLHRVACLYVESKTESSRAEEGVSTQLPENANNQIDSQAWDALPYFTSTGFATDPMMDRNTTNAGNLNDWMNGNRYIMNLLEDDIWDFNAI